MPLFHPNIHRRVWEHLSPDQQHRAVLLLADLLLQHVHALTQETQEVHDE
jgi:stress-induced morphogen